MNISYILFLSDPNNRFRNTITKDEKPLIIENGDVSVTTPVKKVLIIVICDNFSNDHIDFISNIIE